MATNSLEQPQVRRAAGANRSADEGLHCNLGYLRYLHYLSTMIGIDMLVSVTFD